MNCDLPANVETVAELRSWLYQRDPELGSVLMALDIRVAANHTICVSEATSVRGASEIAFMPPMSGG